MSDNKERLAELRAKHGRPPAGPSEPAPVTPTPREAQPRFRGLESGHRACQGCGEALAARLVMESAGPDVMVANATGCLEVFTTMDALIV
jgi:pyruvate ferredoxin oxidoreductase beta subunit